MMLPRPPRGRRRAILPGLGGPRCTRASLQRRLQPMDAEGGDSVVRLSHPSPDEQPCGSQGAARFHQRPEPEEYRDEDEEREARARATLRPTPYRSHGDNTTVGATTRSSRPRSCIGGEGAGFGRGRSRGEHYRRGDGRTRLGISAWLPSMPTTFLTTCATSRYRSFPLPSRRQPADH